MKPAFKVLGRVTHEIVEIRTPRKGFRPPDLDEDIGVEGLLLGRPSAESAPSFERWLQRRREKLPKDAA